MGHDACLEKALTRSKTGQGVKVVLKNVFKEKNWKNSFCHFSLYKFSNSFVKSKWLARARFQWKVDGVLDISPLLYPRTLREWGTFFYLTLGTLWATLVRHWIDCSSVCVKFAFSSDKNLSCFSSSA